LDSRTDPKNYLILTISNTTATFFKVVNGTFTQLATAAITYSAGAAAEINWVDATTVEARYNGKLIQAAATVSDAAVQAGAYSGFASINTGATISRATWYKNYSPDTFATIGDSITSGQGDEVAANGYQAELTNLYTDALHVEQPYRLSSGGWTMVNVQAAIDAWLASAVGTPKKVLLYLGANDVLAMPVEATYKSNLAYIIDAIHAKWANALIYVGCGGRTGEEANTATLTGWNAAVIATKSPYTKVGINYTPIFSGNEATLLADSVHPNNAGYIAMAQAWKAIIG
jgi:lysophospholipase L1-like esterase